MKRVLRGLPLLVIVVLWGCAARSSQTQVAAAPEALSENDVIRLVSVWQDRLCEYIAHAGGGDEAVLAELRGLRSPNGLRPARVTFGVLDVDADPPERHGWDVQGELVGADRNTAGMRYVFVVGILGYSGYVPTRIQDVRVVVLSRAAGTLDWQTSAADPAAVARYRQAFEGPGAKHFPAPDDNFRFTASRDRVSVLEVRSGARWLLTARVKESSVAQAAAPAPSDTGVPRRSCNPA